MHDEQDDVYDDDVHLMIAGLRQLAQTVPIPPPAWVLGRPAVVLTQVHYPLAAAGAVPDPAATPETGRFLVLEDAAQQVQFVLTTHDHTTFLAIEVKPAYRQAFEAQEIQVIWSAGDPASERILCRGRIVEGTVSWKLAENISGWQSLRCEVVHP